MDYSRSHKVLVCLGGIAAALVLLLAVDSTLRLWTKPTGSYSYSWIHGGNFRTIGDPVVGYKPTPNQIGEDIQTSSSGQVLRSVYSIDQLSRRVVPGQNWGRRSRPLIFFGGSFAFGQSVNDNQTLPYYVAELAPDFRVYNYGFNGYGPQNMLALLQKTDIKAQIPEKGKAIGIFVLISDHVRRVVGTMSWVKDNSALPYFVPGPFGRLEFKGSFGQARPWTTAVYRFLSKSGIVRHFGLDWPPITDSNFEMTARIIEESRDAFKARFGSDEFYVVAYPFGWPAGYEEKVIVLLEKAGVRCLDYSAIDLDKELGRRSMLPNSHPIPQAYAAVARKIVRDLRLAKQ